MVASECNSGMEQRIESDTMIFTYDPDRCVTVEGAGREQGVIEGADFARAPWSVRFGPEPPDPEVREGMPGS